MNTSNVQKPKLKLCHPSQLIPQLEFTTHTPVLGIPKSNTVY